MNAPLHSPLVASAVGEMREVLTLLEHLATSGRADSKSVLDACAMLHNSVDEIEQVAGPVPDLSVNTALPVLTMAEIVADALAARRRSTSLSGLQDAPPRRLALSAIDGGRL